MVATTLEKEVRNVVVVSQEKLVFENKIVFKGAADAINGLSTAGMDSVYRKVLGNTVYP